MEQTIRILLLEDRQDDAELVMAALRRAQLKTACKLVSTEAEYRSSLQEKWDIILADYSLPQFSALHALTILREMDSETPLIVVTGAVGEEEAVECIKRGAADYLLKDRLARLGSAIHQALEQSKGRAEAAQARRALEESEQRLRSLIENNSDGLLLLDRDGQVVHRYRDLFETGYCRITESDFLHCMLPEDWTKVREAWERRREGIQMLNFRVEVTGGGLRWIEAVCHDLSDTPGINGVVVHYRDVTERLKLEEQLRISQKMEAVGQLAAGLGHDFNNFLTVLNGYASILSRQTGLPEGAQTPLREIRNVCDRATKLARQLLAFSRNDVKNTQTLDLNEAVINMSPLLETVLGGGVRLLVSQDPNLGTVEADPGKVEQMLLNLAINARDAMEGSGTLRIETTNNLPDGEVILNVADTGCGIDEETRKRIFEPFFTTKSAGQGTGLGLSIVYGIVTGMGGRISVFSEGGTGTTFQIVLPRSTSKISRIPAAPEPVTAQKMFSNAPPTIRSEVMIVDDDEAVRALMRRVLEREGYSVRESRNGREAIQMLEEQDVHLVITDLVMPDREGIETIRMMRQRRPSLKIVAISGSIEPSYLKVAKMVGADAAFAKPLPLDEVLAEVRALLCPTVKSARQSAC